MPGRKKTVNLKITNKQYTESLEPKGEAYVKALSLEDSIEVSTEGTLYDKGNARYITYEESEKAGLDNNKTLIKISGGKLRVRRYGKGDAVGDMDLQLEQGVVNITRYAVPNATIDLEIQTNRIDDGLDEEGYGTIFADYSIKVEPLINRRNKLEIEVSPAGSSGALREQSGPVS